jgi:hypothetical protein
MKQTVTFVDRLAMKVVSVTTKSQQQNESNMEHINAGNSFLSHEILHVKSFEKPFRLNKMRL